MIFQSKQHSDNGSKKEIIYQNIGKYPISVMCRVLRLNRNNFYYKAKPKIKDTDLINRIIQIFNHSRNSYGTRRIKVELARLGYQISRRKIGIIMQNYQLVSKYTKRRYKHHFANTNHALLANKLARNFSPIANKQMQTIVSDLTYVYVAGIWHYICILLDLSNREIIGYEVSRSKDANLVYHAFSKVRHGLNKIKLFHSNRGFEFNNLKIDKLFNTFGIEHSLSKKGCPYDNTVAEATFKVIKTEFVKGNKFASLQELNYKLADYINWFNKFRIHSALGYLSPIEYRKKHL